MAAPPPQFRFGEFAWICHRASLTVCPALGLGDPECYSRNVGFNRFLLFQPSVLAVDISAIIMTIIMIMHIKSKYTAVGRKEMVIFFYLYLVCVIFELLLSTNIIPISVGLYKYFAAGHVAAVTAAITTLFLNGFVGFQWAEDGTKGSVWGFRISALLFGAASYFVALSTFFDAAGMSSRRPLILYINMFIFNGALLALYVLFQILLVLKTLNDRWPLGDLFFGVCFFGMGMTTIFAFSNQICLFAAHYIDGMFLGSGFVLLAVMMVYKFWDSITTEDLEFAVVGGSQVWHLQNTMDLPVKTRLNGE